MSDFIALVLFIAAGSTSPGPNNIMVLASSIRFGFVRTIPHMIGNAIGMVTMTLALGFGLAPILEGVPQLQQILKVLAVAYLVYLGITIARAGSPELSETGSPFRWWQGALFQWVNAKGWSVLLGSLLAFTVSPDRVVNALIVGSTFFCFVLIANCIWMASGGLIRDKVYGGRWHQPVHYMLGSLVILSSLMVLF